MYYTTNKTPRQCKCCTQELNAGQYNTCSMLCFLTLNHAGDLGWYWKSEQGIAERWAHIGANSSIAALNEVRTLKPSKI